VFRYLRETLGERPELVRLYEWNFDVPPNYLESEYGGPNLVEWAENEGGLENIPLEQRVEMIAAIARAVALAHGAGVLHKDLKPANVLVTPEFEGGKRVKLVDFGSASLIEPERLKALGISNPSMTETSSLRAGTLTGTLIYLAPEVLCGERPTAGSDVYALGVMLYQIVIGDFGKPLAPGWESGVEDPLVREDIAAAVCGERGRRLATATELAQRLESLEDRRHEREQQEEVRKLEETKAQRRAAARARRPWVLVTGLALLALIVAVYFARKSPAQAAPVRSVAVLPFQNMGKTSDLDYLSFALSDETATALSYARGLSVRPFRTTSKYSGAAVDPVKAGTELGVAKVVTGHYVQANDQMQVTIEALDVESDSVVWRETVDVAPANNLVEIQRLVNDAVRAGLAPALAPGVATAAGATRPKSSEAYEEFLRTISMASDQGPNQQAIDTLEKAAAVDPNYAPAWQALASRYYNQARYSGNGTMSLDRAQAAAKQALALDPDYVDAGEMSTVILVEQGETAKAYANAAAMVKRRPDSAEAHFALSYVLRYAGLLDEAAQQCEAARSMDPHNARWRSCVAVFEQTADYRKALDFIGLDNPRSEWTRTHLIQNYVRQGKPEAAAGVEAVTGSAWASFNLLQVCAEKRPKAEMDAMASKVHAVDDPELNYAASAHLAYCGKTAEAVPLLRLSIERNHCGYPAMEHDPLLANVRTLPEYGELRQAGVACQQVFLKEKRNSDAAMR
jgi:serine/threonine protein kinase